MKKFCYLILAVGLAGFAMQSCTDYTGPFGDMSAVPELEVDYFYAVNSPGDITYFTIDGSAPTDTVFESGTRAALKVYNPVEVAAPIDTFEMFLKSNARWTGYTTARSGYELITRAGGGDAYAMFRVTTNSSKSNTRSSDVYIYTNDSSQMVKLTFVQLPTQSE